MRKRCAILAPAGLPIVGGNDDDVSMETGGITLPGVVSSLSATEAARFVLLDIARWDD